RACSCRARGHSRRRSPPAAPLGPGARAPARRIRAAGRSRRTRAARRRSRLRSAGRRSSCRGSGARARRRVAPPRESKAARHRRETPRLQDCGPMSSRIWISLAVALAINALALWIANGIFGGVDIEGFWAYFFGALVLGIANSIIKPILAILTLPLIIVT